jgi:hypothetical protein
VSALPKQNKHSGHAIFIHERFEHMEFCEIWCSYRDDCEYCPPSEKWRREIL